MTRIFIEVPLFTKRWKEIGLNDNELVKSLKNEAAKNRS